MVALLHRGASVTVFAQQPQTDFSLEALPRIDPTPANQAAKTFRVLHGFQMELLAAEPLVADPVDLAYDENGRAYVVEMRGYPFPEEKNAPPKKFLGRVRLLLDKSGDGVFDESFVFAEGLSWPTSVACYRGGVFVTAAPDIWYFKDTDGDHRADIRQKVFTGFSRYNVQAIVNNLKWGMDHWIYGAASGNGGQVAAVEEKGGRQVLLRRRDFRFQPATEKFEAISGGARFGHSFDDWGERFLCNIRNPVQHVVLPNRYLSNNPHLAVASTIHDAAISGDQIAVFRISPPEPWRVLRAQRWATERINYPRSELVGAGFFTSSSGVTVYRGSAYPPQFRDNVFVSDVAGNLVHRQILSQRGVTFDSRRADEKAEFVSSTDIWFRPVNYVNAPDGTLHVLDMYRETIEHPWSIPDDIKAKLDLARGNDRGRIWRLAPPGFQPSAPARLGDASTAELVKLLEHANAWHRETAHRLIYERQDQAAIAPLRKLLRGGKRPQSRLHALWSLEGLGALDGKDLQVALRDAQPQVRRHGVRLAEPRLQNDAALRRRILAMSNDPDVRVRFQVALTLGMFPGKQADQTMEALARIALADAANPWMRIAILTSCAERADRVISLLLAPTSFKDQIGGAELVKELARIAGARGRADELSRVIQAVDATQEKLSLDLQYAVVAGLGRGLAQRKKNLGEFLASSSSKGAARLRRLLAQAAQTAIHKSAPVSERLQAIDLLRNQSFDKVRRELTPLLNVDQPRAVQTAVVQTLESFSDPQVATLLLSRWRSLTPPIRSEVIQTLLSRPQWIEPFLTAAEEGLIQPSQTPIPLRARLMGNANADIRRRAERLFGRYAPSPRKEVLAKYRRDLLEKSRPLGDRLAGADVYKRNCQTCHRVGDQGFDVGPTLATVRHRSQEELLIHILDPNREVSPDLIDYTVVLKVGRTLNGVIVAETDAAVTLAGPDNKRQTVLRRDIEQIASTGKSIMPEGLEQKITTSQMADLIAFLKSAETWESPR